MPRHVAIIMDGNGRWANQRGLPRNEGHRRGVENVRTVVRCVGDWGIEYLTLFAFSCENWNRPKEEVSALMDLLERFLKSQAKTLHKQSIRLRVIGRTWELPEKVRVLLDKVLKETAHYTKANLVLALNYGSRTELADAFKAYGEAVLRGEQVPGDCDWPTVARYLYAPDIPDPDLVIRTSGECRVSNFLLMQSAYSEFYFCDKLWPEFGEDEFRAAIENFSRRERRFGKTGAQVQAERHPPVVF